MRVKQDESTEAISFSLLRTRRAHRRARGAEGGRHPAGPPVVVLSVRFRDLRENAREQRAVQAVLSRHGPDSVLGFGMEDTRALKLCLTASIPCFRTQTSHARAVTVFLIN